MTTSSLITTSASPPTPTNRILLTTESPLLIKLVPYAARNQWWRDRVGILALGRDGIVTWASDHTDKLTLLTSHLAFKEYAKSGWEIYLSSIAEKPLWVCLEAFGEWEYGHDWISFEVDLNTTLGGSD